MHKLPYPADFSVANRPRWLLPGVAMRHGRKRTQPKQHYPWMISKSARLGAAPTTSRLGLDDGDQNYQIIVHAIMATQPNKNWRRHLTQITSSVMSVASSGVVFQSSSIRTNRQTIHNWPWPLFILVNINSLHGRVLAVGDVTVVSHFKSYRFHQASRLTTIHSIHATLTNGYYLT